MQLLVLNSGIMVATRVRMLSSELMQGDKVCEICRARCVFVEKI